MTATTDTRRPVAHPEGLVLRALLAPPRVRPIDVARKAEVSRQFVAAVLDGRARASLRVIVACRELGLPVERIWPDRAAEIRDAVG